MFSSFKGYLAKPLIKALPPREGVDALPFSMGSSQPRDQTQVSCIAGALLHCRQILYGLSYQGSPEYCVFKYYVFKYVVQALILFLKKGLRSA